MRDEYNSLPHGLGNRYLRREPSASADHLKIMPNGQRQDHRFGFFARVHGMATSTAIGFFGSGSDENFYRRTS
jgi:hypothetical protein